MPIYEIVHKPTGKTFELTGDRPPTEQELDEIFKQAIDSSETKPPEELTPIEQQWNAATSNLGVPEQKTIPPLIPAKEDVSTFKEQTEPGLYIADKKIEDVPVSMSDVAAKGAIRGAVQLKGIGQALGSQVADVAGQELLSRELIKDYTTTMKTVKDKYAQQVPQLKDIKTPEDAAVFVTEGITENLAMFLPSFVTGGIGAIAAKTLAKGIAEKLMAEVGAKEAAKYVAKKITLGSAIGAVPTGVAIESGSIYGDIYEKTGKQEAGTAAAFGALAGGIEAFPVIRAIKKISQPFAEGVKHALIRRYGEAAAKQFLSEGLTEGAQTMLEEAAVKSVSHEDYFTKELFDNVITSIVKGGLGGAVVGTGTQAVGEGIQKIKGTPKPETIGTDKANIPPLELMDKEVEVGQNLPVVEKPAVSEDVDKTVNNELSNSEKELTFADEAVKESTDKQQRAKIRQTIEDVSAIALERWKKSHPGQTPTQSEIDAISFGVDEASRNHASHLPAARHKNSKTAKIRTIPEGYVNVHVEGDLDYFKRYNDNVSQEFGNVVLDQVMNDMNESAAPKGMSLFHETGDEFSFVDQIKKEDLPAYLAKLREIKQDIDAFQIQLPNGKWVPASATLSVSTDISSAGKLLKNTKKANKNSLTFDENLKKLYPNEAVDIIGKDMKDEYEQAGLHATTRETSEQPSTDVPVQGQGGAGFVDINGATDNGPGSSSVTGKTPTKPSVTPPAKKKVFVAPPSIETPEQATNRQRSVKQAIQESTGIKRTDEDIVISEHDALKAVLQSVQRNTKIASGNIRKDLRREILLKSKSKTTQIKELQDAAKTYADISEVASRDRLRLRANIMGIKSNTSFSRILQQIDIMEQKAGRDVAIGEMKKTMAKAEKKLDKMRPEYASKVQPILDSIDPVKHPQGKINKLNSILDWLESDPENVLPPDVMKELRTLDKKNVVDMTVDDINNVTNTLQLYLHLNELKNKLISKGKAREFTDIKEKAIENLTKKEELEKQKNSILIEGVESKRTTGGFGEKIKNIFTTGSSSMEFVSQLLDNVVDKASGVFHNIFYEGINEGQRITDTQYYEAIDSFRDATKKVDMEGWSEAFYKPKEWGKKVNYTEYTLDSGKKIKLSPAERGAIYLHSLNENNLRHMLEGGISREREKHVIIKLTGDDVNQIVNSLTDNEKKVADYIGNYLDTKQADDINKTSVELNGFEIAKEDNYWPIRTNELDRSINSLKVAMTPENIGGFSQVSIEGMGMLKSRTRAKNAIILDDMFVGFVKSIEQATAYSGLAPALRNAKMLINDKQIKQEIVKRFGENYLNYVKKFIRDIEGNATETTDIDRVITTGMGKLSVGILGANPFVVMIQPASYPLAMSEINGKYLAKAMKTGEKEDVVRKWSPELRKRFEGMSSTEMGEVMNAGSVRMVVLGEKNLGQKIMGGIIWADKQTILRIWKAVQYETEALHPELTGDAKMEHIARRTELITRRTQSVSDTKDRSEMARSQNMFVRLATMFTSQSNKIYEGVGRGILRYNSSPKSKQDKANLLGTISLLIIGNGLMLAARDAIKRGIAGDFGDDPFEDKAAKEFNLGLRLISSAMSNVYFAGPLFNSFVSYKQAEGFGGWNVQDPLTATINETVKATDEITSLVEKIATQEKYKDGERQGELKFKTNLIKLVNSLGSASKLAGVPYNPIKYATKTVAYYTGVREKQILNSALKAVDSNDWFKRQQFRAWWKEADKETKDKFNKFAIEKHGETYFDKMEKTLDESSDRDAKMESYQNAEDRLVNDYSDGKIKLEDFTNKKQKIDDERKRLNATKYGEKPPKPE